MAATRTRISSSVSNVGLIVFHSEPERTSFHRTSERSAAQCFYEQERLYFVSVSPTHKFDRMVTVKLSWTTFFDLTLNATDTCASVASHTRASTTLKNDTGVVGSVTVHPRATHATEKCIIGGKTQPQSQQFEQWHALFECICQAIDQNINQHPFQLPRNYSLVHFL